MNRLPRELAKSSGLTFAQLGDITQIPAYKLRRAASGEPCLTVDEFAKATRVISMYAENRRRAEAALTA